MSSATPMMRRPGTIISGHSTDRSSSAFWAAPAPVRPLRVIRVVDGHQGEGRSTNRMVISGRMADVCAELDRLAALEAMETISATPRSTQLH